MKSVAALCVLAAAALAISPVLAAPEPTGGSAYGLVVAKGLNWVEVSEKGAAAVRYYSPEPKTAADNAMLHTVRRAPVGGEVVLVWRRDGATLRVEKLETVLPAKDAPRSATVAPRGARRFWFPSISVSGPAPGPQINRVRPYLLAEAQRFGQPYQGQSGRVIGRVLEKGNDWISIAGMDIVFSESTRFRAPDVLIDGRVAADPAVVEAIGQVEADRQVVAYWVYDDGLRVVRLSELRNYDPYSPAGLNHSWPGPKQ